MEKDLKQRIALGVKTLHIILDHKKYSEMTNKVHREKSNCVVCLSYKSRFLKQKHNNKK